MYEISLHWDFCCLGLLSDGLEKGDDPLCIIDIDLFHYLMAVTMALPSLYTEGATASNLPLNSLNNQYILELVLTAHIVQTMLLYDTPADEAEGTARNIVFI